MKKRILLVTSRLDDGGAEKWMVDTLSYMDRTDMQFDYYLFENIKKDTFQIRYQKMGVEIHERNLHLMKIPTAMALRTDLERFIDKYGPYAAIHVNGTPLVYQMAAMQAAQKKNIPVRIVHSHSSEASDLHGVKKAVRKIMRKNVYKNATVIGACSTLAGKKKYGEKVQSSKKFVILRNGIDTQKFRYSPQEREAIRKQLKLQNEFTLLHIGRLAKEKNHMFLVEIFSKILCMEPNAHLILVGSGEDEKAVLKKGKELKILDKIIHIPRTSEAQKYYQAADVFVLPSFFEGFGTVLIEAQAAGLPCFASDVVPSEADITNTICFLPLTQTAEEWANEILQAQGAKRSDGSELVRTAGYDIYNTAREFKIMLCVKGEEKPNGSTTNFCDRSNL